MGRWGGVGGAGESGKGRLGGYAENRNRVD